MLNLIMATQKRNPYPAYWLMRRTKPLVHLPKHKLWLASRYDDVKHVLTDHKSFSSDYRRLLGAEATDGPARASLITSDPPMHTKLRGLASRAFTAKAVADLEPRVRTLAHEMLDAVIETGEMDVVRDLAYPLPVIVIAELLGIPSEDRAQFKVWSDRIVAAADQLFENRDALSGGGTIDTDMPPEVMAEMGPYLEAIIARRRLAPKDDLLSGLIAAEIDGERLTERDVMSFIALLLTAGNVTTTNLISNAVLTFMEHPDVLARLRADLSLLPGAIEEVLRYRSPVQFMFRVTTEDVVLGGRTIPERQLVIALIGSANRDEAKFAHANRFDITRTPNQHIAFGHGIHYCLGAPLARLEGRVVLTAVLERLHTMKRASRGPLQPGDALILHGIKSLPLRFMLGQAAPV